MVLVNVQYSSGDCTAPTPLNLHNNAMQLTDGSVATLNKRIPLMKIIKTEYAGNPKDYI